VAHIANFLEILKVFLVYSLILFIFALTAMVISDSYTSNICSESIGSIERKKIPAFLIMWFSVSSVKMYIICSTL